MFNLIQAEGHLMAPFCVSTIDSLLFRLKHNLFLKNVYVRVKIAGVIKSELSSDHNSKIF